MHLDVRYFLSQLNLSQYEDIFARFSGVEDMLDLDESEMKAMGVKNGAHRAKLASSLVLLRAKYKSSAKRTNKISDDLIRHSTAFSDASGSHTMLHALLNCQHSQSASQLHYTMDEESLLRRQLEWELNQDSRQLESHAWYHGAISRAHSESLLRRDGDFLVRDCSSGQPGDLVLSCVWKGTPLHFVISKIIVQPNTVYESIKYRIEDEPFDSVSDLITCYVGNSRPVSMATNARISSPINRLFPLSYYTKHMSGSTYNHYMSRSFSPRQSPPHWDIRAQSASPPDQNPGGSRKAQYSSQSLPRPLTNSYKLVRIPSENSIQRSARQDSDPVPPPKPDRSSTVTDESAETSNTDEVSQEPLPETFGKPLDSLTLPRVRQRNVAGDRRSCDLEMETSLAQSVAEVDDDDRTPTVCEAVVFRMPEHLQVSAFDFENFQTLLLPSLENKPLDATTMKAITLLFEEHAPKSMALHLLHADLDIIGGDFDLPNACFRKNRHPHFGISSGIELCTLPHGQQLRQDLLERTVCLKLFVALTILTCSSDAEDRAAVLDYWIQVAIESKTALGNLYSFAGLMLALSIPQIQRLESTWHILRQRYTNTACTFEAGLRPLMKTASEGNNPHAPNTTIPDLRSAILLWEASAETFTESDGLSIPSLNVQLSNSGPDFGIDSFSNHLNLVRSWSINLPLYIRNSRNALANVRFDEVLLDMFSTEFQARFLWGSRGALAEAGQRYMKFEQVLSVLSERCEPAAC